MSDFMAGMMPRRPLDRLVRDPSIRSALTYWEELRAGQLVPPRLALDPARMRHLLQQSAILEQVQPGTVRIRLGGARISALMGMEVRGLPVRALFDLSDRGRIAAEVTRAFETPSVLLMNLAAPAPRHQMGTAHRTQMAVLPMSDQNFCVNRALLVLGDREAGADRPIETPLRWSVERLDMVPLRAGAPVTSHVSASTVRTAAPPRTEASENESEARGLMARARFRVIEGGLA